MISLEVVRLALRLPDFDALAAQMPMIPGSRRLHPQQKTEQSRQAGVLVLLFPENDALQLVLTRRTDTLRGHRGQVSFPGGQHDLSDVNLAATALRETCEELGVCEDEVEILGTLSTIYIPPSDFEVFPSVGAMPQRPTLKPNPAEVASVFTVPLDALLDPQFKANEQRDFQGIAVDVPYYAFNGHKVWGATAIMLSELEGRLRIALTNHPR